ncbi:MAG: hypothetical protein KME05_07775 [Gloeocapsa sp. UFS-A4-WI-NPMV-4B04]|nr:hypothetical protein [Gloeocapsa sp. UFS-A4-WI-NPMV-4B04]
MVCNVPNVSSPSSGTYLPHSRPIARYYNAMSGGRISSVVSVLGVCSVVVVIGTVWECRALLYFKDVTDCQSL